MDVCFRGQGGHDADKPPLRLRGPPWALFAGLAKTAARKALRSGKGISKVAKELGLGVGTVHRIKLEMNEAA